MKLRRIAAGALLYVAACSETERQGELVIAFATDLAMPEQIDNVHVEVSVFGRKYLDTDYAVGRDDYQVPATLTLAAGEDPSTPVEIRVFGQKNGAWRTVREVTTTIPTGRSALLRMPIQWLCDGRVRTETIPDLSGGFEVEARAGCEDESHTCIAGVCKPKLVSTPLPTFGPQQVFGGASEPARGSCFDTVRCMEEGRVYVPDADCTVERPISERLNFALRVTDDGICDATKTACFVPLDADSDEGWLLMADGERVQITPGACDALRDRRANALYASETCDPKYASLPPCGDWSSVRGDGEGMPMEMPPVSLAKPKEVIDLLAGTAAQLCCPLMEDGGKLFSCICERKSEATLVMVDPAQETPLRMTVGAVSPADSRERMRFGASLYAGAIFWQADRDLIRRTPLPMTGATPGMWTVDGAVYESTSLLASSAGVFVLASGVADATGAPVQMIGLTNGVRSFDTGSTQPVFQFDQDELALYLAVAIDAADSGRTRRTARVVRMDKATGELRTILEDRVLMLDDPLRGGGYTGVQLDGSTLYALFEDAPDADGSLTAELHRVDLMAPGTPSVVYRTTLDRAVSQLGMIGAIDGAVLLSRIELAADGGATIVRGSSVIVVPPGGGALVPSSQAELSGGARILADFPRDYPGQDLASDNTQVYWLNSSGRLYSFPRTALQ